MKLKIQHMCHQQSTFNQHEMNKFIKKHVKLKQNIDYKWPIFRNILLFIPILKIKLKEKNFFSFL